MSSIFWKTFLGHRPITMNRQPTSKRNKKPVVIQRVPVAICLVFCFTLTRNKKKKAHGTTFFVGGSSNQVKYGFDIDLIPTQILTT
jgi:hypothetical protein